MSDQDEPPVENEPEDQGAEVAKAEPVELATAPKTAEPQETTAPATHPLDRRTTLRLAVAGGIFALAGALIGSCSSYMINNATIRAQQEQSVEQFRRDQRRDIYANILKEATNLRNTSRDIQSRLELTAALADAARRFSETMPPPPPSPPPPPPPQDQSNAVDEADRRFLDEIKPEALQEKWQAAYNSLDTAIADAELVASRHVLELALAIRDRNQRDFSEAFKAAINKRFESSGALYLPLPGPGVITGEVPSTTPPTRYDPELLNKTPEELHSMYVQAAKDDLALND